MTYSFDILSPTDAPTLPTDSQLPAPQEIVDAFDHPAWFRPDDEQQSKYFLSYFHRGGQIPIDTPDTAWTNSYGFRINIRYDEHADGLRFKPDRHLDEKDCHVFPNNLGEMADQVRTEMQSRHQFQEYLRLRGLKDPSGNHLPHDLVEHLRNNYGSLYMLHQLSEEELLNIPQMGEARVESIHNSLESVLDPPQWAVSCQCPNCDASYTDPFRSSLDRSLEIAHQLTYCPACLHDTIPKEMILGPRTFNPD